MELVNEVLKDYANYCHDKLIEEFKGYDYTKFDSIYWYERYKYRIIDSKKRKIVEAFEFSIPNKYQSAYELIKQDILDGQSLKKYQSKKLEIIGYNDDMLSHWGIQHLHLGLDVKPDGYIERTSDLLFVFFKETTAYIVGVYNHKSWCDIDIIESIHKNWPSNLAVYKSNKIVQVQYKEQQKNLRSRNACCNVIVSDGTEYFPPGGGVKVDGVPLNIINDYNKVIEMLNDYFETIKDNIKIIIESDPKVRNSETLTIGMRICHKKGYIFKIKETGFEFKLQLTS
ncbi:hypothetical protein [Colwellia sp. 20A7]|uniref:hypothetical protein n=1 Tax=Colwellia sp. 20A7 TaxID=2689569 RepID=UPI001359A4CB|nr:hypothetical protein [Colwellia sp. 20A7]